MLAPNGVPARIPTRDSGISLCEDQLREAAAGMILNLVLERRGLPDC